MSIPFRAGALAVLLLTAACSDLTRPVDPDRPDLAHGPFWQEPPDADRARDQRLARRFALALADPAFRAEVFAGIRDSKQREQRIQLQRFLRGNGYRALTRMTRVLNEPVEPTLTDLADAPAMEVYLPVAEHRRRWRGDTDLLVATARLDGEIPVAFDTRGRKHLLDPARPPTVPVLAVQEWEGPDAERCIEGCGVSHFYGDGADPYGPLIPSPPAESDPYPPPTHYPPITPAASGALYLTGTRFFDTFESWLKGAPEFEIHILGQKTGSTELVSHQCVGENAGGAYTFNQDDLSWSGSVLMFSQTQLDNFAAWHPGQGLRLLVLEDDDGPCDIRVDKDRVTQLFKSVDAAYAGWTSGKKIRITQATEVFERARSWYDVVSNLAAFFATNDDLVGTAVEDPGAAGLVLPGATWIVRGANNVTTGALRLVIR